MDFDIVLFIRGRSLGIALGGYVSIVRVEKYI